jgi:hypothetical protein
LSQEIVNAQTIFEADSPKLQMNCGDAKAWDPQPAFLINDKPPDAIPIPHTGMLECTKPKASSYLALSL